MPNDTVPFDLITKWDFLVVFIDINFRFVMSCVGGQLDLVAVQDIGEVGGQNMSKCE